MINFYWYPKCSTCKKAKKWLDDHGVHYEAIDMIQNVPSERQLLTWMHESQLPRRRYFNTSGQLYRASGLKDKLDDMTLEECAAELAKDGMMIRRPILAVDDAVTFGFKEETYRELLGIEE